MELIRPYKCKFPCCDKAYTNTSHLKRHMEVHNSTSETFSCKLCSVSISTQSNLKRHYNRVHNPDRQLFCLECKKLFRKKNLYEEHMAIHKNSSLLKCEKCGKMFINQSRLHKHEQYHKSKNYVCPYEGCSEILENHSALTAHKKIHEDFCCVHCEKVFTSRASLTNHLKVHSESRSSIACPYKNCNRIYYFKRNLEQHIRTNHLGNKFHCDICDRKLSTKQKIKEHIIKIHLSEKRPFKRKDPAPRKDTGIPKRSALTMLTGIQLSVKAEVHLMQRIPSALQRDKLAEESSFSEDDRASDISAKGA